LKHHTFAGRAPMLLPIARPQGRARIETPVTTAATTPCAVQSPGLKAGRGLKPKQEDRLSAFLFQSPGLKAGRGLKLVSSILSPKKMTDQSPGLKAGRGLKLE